MKARRIAAVGLLAAVAVIFLRRLRQWAGEPPVQRTSHKEAIEPPELVARYSRFMGLLPMRVMRAYLARYVAAGAVQWRILDVGCGPGWFPLELADTAPDAMVTGVDLSHPMTVTAVAHAANHRNAQRVHFAQARGEVLPFADGTFDLIVSTLALHHLQDPVAALAELRRVVRPSGRIVVFDTRRNLHPWLWTALKVSQVFVDGLALCENGEPAASIGASYTASEAQRLALQAGWERVQARAGIGWIILERRAAPTNSMPLPPVPHRRREKPS